MSQIHEAEHIASKFYHEVLAPFKAVESCWAIGDLSTRRQVVNLASTVFHFPEHLPDCISASTVDWKKTNRSYKLLGDMANASKHGKIDRHFPEIKRSKDIFECIVLTQYVYGERLLYEDLSATVMAVKTDGSFVDAVTLLRDVINFLGTYLNTYSILDHYEPLTDAFPMPVPQNMARKRGPAIVVRKGEIVDPRQLSGNEICLIITQGVYASIRLIVQAFDYASMQRRPMPTLKGVGAAALRLESKNANT
ncbi:hypothetical protein SH501x_001232 [Pirellulaceae bacterium SH501]